MRRLIAYISLVVAIILGVGFNALAPLRSINSNLEYTSGREFVYKISAKANELDPSVDADLKDGAIDEVFDIMDSRMKTYGVSEYQLSKEGSDTIRATATLGSDSEYNRLQTYLNYSANFTLRVAKTDETEAIANPEEVFDNVKARIEYTGPYPFIVIPLSNPSILKDTVIPAAQKIQEAEQTIGEDGQTNTELVDNAKIIMWTNYDPDTDVYADSSTNNDIAAKIFLTFDYRNMWWNEDQTEIAVASPFAEEAYNEQNKYTTAQIKTATDTARFMVNVFNAGTYDYEVDFLFSNTSYQPSVEPLIVFGSKDRVALSRTLIASVAALVIVFIALFIVYRLPVLSIVSSVLTTFVGTILLFNAISIEMSTSAIIGLMLVTAIAVMGGVSYLSKFKNELYRGRSMKKAHIEAIKRSTFINIDTLVISLIVGVITYFAGNSATLGFGTVLIFGSIVSIITILLHNAIMFWLIANNTATSKSYKLFGIDKNRVPDLLESQEPEYFGRFVSPNNSPTTFAKPLGMIFGVLAVASMITIGVFAGLNKSPLNLSVQDNNTTRIYLRVSEKSKIDVNSTNNSPQLILESFKVNDEALVLVKDNDIAVYERHDYTTTTGEGENKISQNFIYYVYTVEGHFDNNTTVTYAKGDVQESGSFVDVLQTVIETVDADATISINAVVRQATNPSVTSIVILYSLISLFTSIYFLFRRGIANAIANFIVSISAGALVIGFFVATRISVHPLVAIGALVAITSVALINNIVFNYIKLTKNDKLKMINELDTNKKEELGLSMALTPVYVVFATLAVSFLIYLAIVPTQVTMVYVSGLIATVLAIALVTRIQLPLTRIIAKFFKRLTSIFNKTPKTGNKTKAKANAEKTRSSEVEEAIIIGIND